jgi:3-oxoacyl-[acyl-carrier-protein] synthase II
MAVAAARMARADAGLLDGDVSPLTGVVMATAFGPVRSTEQILDSLRRDGPLGASPFIFAESVANAAAGQVAIDAGAHGPNLTVLQREAGALTAVGRGAALLASGACERVIVGNVDQMSPVLHALLDRFGALARAPRDEDELARPFDRRRNGFIAAEGAVVLILENEDDAQARGARPKARLRGFGSRFDGTAPRNGWGGGDLPLAGAIERTLAGAGVAAADITQIVSGAPGALAADRLEALILRRLWPDSERPAVLTPKAHIGQYGGGFLAAAILAAGGGWFGPPPGFEEVDPELNVRPHPGGWLDPASPSLVTSFASGGSAAWLLLEGP